MYLQSNQPLNQQQSNRSFDWSEAAGAFAIGAVGNFTQDVVLNQVTKRTKNSKHGFISKPSQFYQDLMMSDKPGKLTDNKGIQRMLGPNALNHKFTRNTLGKLPNMVPGTTGGKIMGYGVIPLAGAIFAGLTGETTAEAATKTITGAPHKKEEIR